VPISKVGFPSAPRVPIRLTNAPRVPIGLTSAPRVPIVALMHHGCLWPCFGMCKRLDTHVNYSR
jgi:hypothetical protein